MNANTAHEHGRAQIRADSDACASEESQTSTREGLDHGQLSMKGLLEMIEIETRNLQREAAEHTKNLEELLVLQRQQDEVYSRIEDALKPWGKVS